MFASGSALIVGILLFVTFQWTSSEIVPKEESLLDPSSRPTAKEASTETWSAPLAQNPSSWQPKVASYGDEGSYGYLSGYRDTVNLRHPGSGPKSLKLGENLYKSNCVSCHGEAGRPSASLRVPARDLSNPVGYQYGSSDQAIYRSIAYGVPKAPSMGRFKGVLKESEIWAVVNYIKTL